ncbi:MAG: DUF1543 domain-containing protein [Alphaproteobacteria bacterium]|nr:DUF1543 domain-containing protein [Alphaproteobacteria bacterium]
MNLFVFYLGGKTATSLIEVHDVRFAVGESVEACHDFLRTQWWGEAKGLHIDCYGVLDYADGYDVALSRDPASGDAKLYFVNLGGYDAAQFTELHRNVFVVAAGEAAAKAKAKAQIAGWDLPHKDNICEIDALLPVGDALAGQGWHLRLTPAATPRPFVFTCGYFPIG